jgi:hypothetical protein
LTGNEYLPSWANNIHDIAADNAQFAHATGITGIAPNANHFKGGQNQRFKQHKGAQSLHGQVQQSTGISQGHVAHAKRGLAATTTSTTTRKTINKELELITTVDAATRGRSFQLANSGHKDVEVTLAFTGSTGVSVVVQLDADTHVSALCCTTIVPANATRDCGEIAIAPGRASVNMGLSVQTIVKDTTTTTTTTTKRGPPPKPPPTTNAAPPTTAVAAHAFEAAEEDECTLNEGDEVHLLGDASSGWVEVLNLTTGHQGLVPFNHLDQHATPKASAGSLNTVYQPCQHRRGSWVGGRANRGANLVRKVRQDSFTQNNAEDWNDATTNAQVRHVPSGKTGLVLGETDGVSIVQFDDGTVDQVPSDQVERVKDGPGATKRVTTTKTVTRRVVERKPPRTSTTTTKQYLTKRAIDGIRVDYRSRGQQEVVRKAKAAHPKQRQLNALRKGGKGGKGGPPASAPKSWKTFGH